MQDGNAGRSSKYRHILVIDDDLDDQAFFSYALNKASTGLHCEYQTNPLEALEELKSGSTRPDIIFLDLNMPGMSGQEVLLELKNSEGLDDIPVVICSTSAHSPTIELMKDLGAAAYIVKPTSIQELASKIRETLYN